MNNNKYKQRSFYKVATLLLIVALIGSFFYAEKLKDEIAIQEQLKNEIVLDNDSLIKQLYEVNKQNKLLEESIKSKQETIDRLMKLETAQEIKSVVMSEARGSTLQDQCAVTQTILDRSTTWGISAKEVITASGQYASPFKGQISDSVNTAFDLVFVDGYRPLEEITTHFSSKDTYWTENKAYRGKIGVHKYYGPKEGVE